MKVYVLMSDNGEEYDDYRSFVIDIFSSLEGAEKEKFILDHPQLKLMTEEEFDASFEEKEDFLEDYEYYVREITSRHKTKLRCNRWIDTFEVR